MSNLKKEELSKIFCEFKLDNKDSYNILYKNYYSLIYGIVFPILKNKENSEDVVQEIFVKIYNMDKEKFPKKGELSWLYTVSKNEALNYLRKKKQEVNIEDIYEVSEESSEIEEFIDIYTYNKIISGLNEQEKQIVSLKILSNFTFKKIGQMLDIPTPTVQWKYYKAVDSLKISLSNFVGFIFAFILLMVRKEKVNNNREKSINGVKNNIEQSEDVLESTTEKSSQSSSVKEDSSSYTNQEFMNSILEKGEQNIEDTQEKIEITVQDANEVQEDIDIVQPILMGICGIFLIISIIFAIFFKNHQQKRSKKTSKII